MNGFTPALRSALMLAAGAAVVSLITGAAFAGWIDHGPAMFLSMIETGAAWCF